MRPLRTQVYVRLCGFVMIMPVLAARAPDTMLVASSLREGWLSEANPQCIDEASRKAIRAVRHYMQGGFMQGLFMWEATGSSHWA